MPLIYLDEKRSFGGALDNAATRLEHYHQVIERSLAGRAETRSGPRRIPAPSAETWPDERRRQRVLRPPASAQRRASTAAR